VWLPPYFHKGKEVVRFGYIPGTNFDVSLWDVHFIADLLNYTPHQEYNEEKKIITPALAPLG